MNYLDGIDIELADVQMVINAIERKLDWVRENEVGTYAKTKEYELETTWYALNDLLMDVAERLEKEN